jgi:hypothetical protein
VLRIILREEVVEGGPEDMIVTVWVEGVDLYAGGGRGTTEWNDSLQVDNIEIPRIDFKIPLNEAADMKLGRFCHRRD